MPLKDYQQSLLDDYAAYLARTRELSDPDKAFRESTQFGQPYYPLPGAEAILTAHRRLPITFQTSNGGLEMLRESRGRFGCKPLRTNSIPTSSSVCMAA